MSKHYLFLIAAGISAWVGTGRADIKLPGIFSDNMVLQQGMRVPVWGWADPNEEVTVEFHDQRIKTRARDGKWTVRLRPLNAGGPDELIVSGKNRIVLRNVLVGEVWVCSGQSNMEWPVRASYQPGDAIQSAENSMVRLFTVPKLKLDHPTNNLNASWQLCQPRSVSNFSAVAYYFGRALQKEIKIPVGLIHTSWGGSPAEVWIRESVLSGNPAYKRDILETSEKAYARYQEELAKWQQETAQKSGTTPARNRPNAPWKPAELYNGMIAPLLPYAIKGAIWYQGESNAGRAHQYRSLFADMIRNWRTDWSQGEFPFLMVQLAPWDKNRRRSLEEITAATGESDWAELREAQLLTTKSLPKVGMAVITDVGDKDDIHPAKKLEVGERLALAARGIAYGEKIEYAGPTYRSMKVKDGRVVLSFDHVGKGLEGRGGPLQGFTIAGPDRKFVRAEAEISRDQVIVSSPEVKQPVAVRYGWSDYPLVNLWNKNGLPATPFRTDTFPGITEPKTNAN